MLGFGLGAVCNNIFLDFSKPRFHQTDPNWVSAWYLGFLVIGVAVFVFAFIIGCFPAHISNGRATLDYYAEASSKQSEADLSSCDVKPSSADGARASWREFAHDMKRLLTNFPFMCRAFSNVLDGMIITGFLAFFFKFIAQQFQLSQALASLAGGVPTIFGIALGVVAGGLLIRRYRLQPKHVCLMLVISAAIMCVVSLVSINLGCERTEVLGLNGSESLHRFYEGYNVRFNDTYCSSSMNCGCSELEFRPVYDPKSGVNFYSPCHAGCSKYQVREWHDEEFRYYDNCSCTKNSVWFYDDVDNQMLNGRMIGGFAPKECHLLWVFIVVFFVAMFFLGLPLAGSIMVQYRLVDPDLKSMSTALATVLTSAFGYLPAPIFMGAIVDSTCRLWQKSSCGENKFCLLYDTDEFRWRFLMTAACIKAIGSVLDIIVTFKMWHMRFDRSAIERAAVPGTFASMNSSLTNASSCPSFSSAYSEANLELEGNSRLSERIRKNYSMNDLATSKL
ncbi:hypothetical protein RvY_15585-2 [Ramazzottius varieornatus]|uniref:Solute carrier organic anion transporter family member n=1 Tax=Ramazzottius varieornatus TaxID=947166 RepID=A0A1D1VYM4_RAMVA|nr:hypothetical protein RvY_15585-2 [Ramazzottius varieornatus]